MTDWNKVAQYLEFKIYRIRIIQEKHKHDYMGLWLHLLEEWIGTNQGVTPKNWATLLSILRQNELGIPYYCDQIEKYLKE